MPDYNELVLELERSTGSVMHCSSCTDNCRNTKTRGARGGISSPPSFLRKHLLPSHPSVGAPAAHGLQYSLELELRVDLPMKFVSDY